MVKKPPISRREYQKKRITISKESVPKTRSAYTHVKLNFWQLFSNRPYLSVIIIVLAIFFVMAELWWLLAILVIGVAFGIVFIAHSHHPDRMLSFEFKLKAGKKLSILKALQFGAAIIMFLATYMKKVVVVNFPSVGSTDGLQVVQGLLSTHGGSYGQQGSYFLGLLNTLSGGQFWGSYRYAANSAQMMNSGAGRYIVMWILLLMIAPAICVLSQFLKEPYSRNCELFFAIVSSVSFGLTPYLMKHWIVDYAVEKQMNFSSAQKAVAIGPMAYVAFICALIVLIIAIYRVIKQDKFGK